VARPLYFYSAHFTSLHPILDAGAAQKIGLYDVKAFCTILFYYHSKQFRLFFKTPQQAASSDVSYYDVEFQEDLNTQLQGSALTVTMYVLFLISGIYWPKRVAQPPGPQFGTQQVRLSATASFRKRKLADEPETRTLPNCLGFCYCPHDGTQQA
jgi:hypothetical protein